MMMMMMIMMMVMMIMMIMMIMIMIMIMIMMILKTSGGAPDRQGYPDQTVQLRKQSGHCTIFCSRDPDSYNTRDFYLKFMYLA